MDRKCMWRDKIWAMGWRCFALCFMLVILAAWSKADPPRTSQKHRQSITIASPPVAIQNQVDKPAQRETNAEQVAGKDSLQEEAIMSAPEAEDFATTEPMLIISGRVRLRDGSPARGTVVRLTKETLVRPGKGHLREEEIARAVTDDSGYYTLIAPDHPYYFLKASKEGCTMVSATIRDDRAIMGERRKGIREIRRDIVMLPAASIRGRVVDEKGQPVAAANVMAASLEQQVQQQVVTKNESSTDENGSFVIDGIAAGKVSLFVQSPRHVLMSRVVSAPAKEVVLRLESEGSCIQGHVYLLPSREPISGIGVVLRLDRHIPPLPFSVKARHVITNQHGAFRFERLAAGTYELWVAKSPGWDHLSLVPTKGVRRHHIVLAEKEIKDGIELFLYTGHTIKGKVTDRDTGLPLEGVKVFIARSGDPEKFTKVTGPEGEYTLTGVTASSVELRAEKKGYLVAGQEPRLTFYHIRPKPDNMEIIYNIEMLSLVTISGMVETIERYPITNATVALYSPHDYSLRNQFIPVDDSGAFTVEAKPFVPCRIKAQAPGYAPAFSDALDIQDFSINGVSIILNQSALLSGIVVGPDDQPVALARVKAMNTLPMGPYDMSDNLGETNSDSWGRFTFSDLPSGEIRLMAQQVGFASSKDNKIILNPGEVKSGVKLYLREPQFLEGRITTADGKPMPNVRVSVATRQDENSYAQVQTDWEGRYRIESLADRVHNLSIYHPDHVFESHAGTKVGRDDADFVFGTKNAVTMVGKVVDWKSGEPIADFTVSTLQGARLQKDLNVPGQFKAMNLKPEFAYGFRIEAQGYSYFYTNWIHVPDDQKEFEKVFKLGPGGSIRGRVISRESKEPLFGVRVYLKGVGDDTSTYQRLPDATTTTDIEGRFEFQGAPSGRIAVVFALPDPYVVENRRIDVQHATVADFGVVEIGYGEPASSSN